MGSVIKKITRPIKKIAKSPIGKAALAAAAIRFGGPAIFGASESTNPLIIALKKGQIGGTIAALPSLLTKDPTKAFTLGNLDPFKTIAGISALSGLLTAREQKSEEEIAAMSPEERNRYVSKLRAAYTANLARGFPGVGSVPYAMAAEGGRVGMVAGGIMRLKKLLDEAYDMVTSRGDFDFSDYKMRGQLMAEELSELKFGKDYYDLDQKTQMELYKQSSDYLDNVADDAADNLFDRMKEGRKGGGRVGLAEGSGSLESAKDFIESTGDEELMDMYIDVVKGIRPEEALLRLLRKKGYQTYAVGGQVDMPTGIMRTNAAGIKERDYRDEGGFVPVGIKEKADDVPAMLSKNEFVMTADAVRGAGDGSIEKGAQKMYDTMKKLEDKVA